MNTFVGQGEVMQKEIVLPFPLLPSEMAAADVLQPEQSPTASEECHHPARGDLAPPHFLLSGRTHGYLRIPGCSLCCHRHLPASSVLEASLCTLDSPWLCIWSLSHTPRKPCSGQEIVCFQGNYEASNA